MLSKVLTEHKKKQSYIISPSASTARSEFAKSESEDRATRTAINSATVILIAPLMSLVSVSRYTFKTVGSFAWKKKENNAIN